MTAPPNSGITKPPLPHIDELFACSSYAETRPLELRHGARRPPAPAEPVHAASPTAATAGYYTHSRPSDLSRYRLSPRDKPSGEHWHHVPRQYVPAGPAENRPTPPLPPPLSILPPAAPAPPSPAQLWPGASAHKHGGGYRQDEPRRRSHGGPTPSPSPSPGHGPGYTQAGYSPREYHERDYRGGGHSDGYYRGAAPFGGGGGGYRAGETGDYFSAGAHGPSGYGQNGYTPAPASTPGAAAGGGQLGKAAAGRDATPPRLGKKKRPNLPKEAVEVMMAWVDSHIECPFERQDRPDLVQRTKLEEKRVTDWFTNFRRRKWRHYRVEVYDRQVAHWKAAGRAAQEEADRSMAAAADAARDPAEAEAARRAAEAAIRRVAEAESARCAAEASRHRARVELEKWQVEQRTKRAEKSAKKRAGLLVDEEDDEESEED